MYPNKYYCIMVFRVCQEEFRFFCSFVSIILNKLKKKVGQKTKSRAAAWSCAGCAAGWSSWMKQLDEAAGWSSRMKQLDEAAGWSGWMKRLDEAGAQLQKKIKKALRSGWAVRIRWTVARAKPLQAFFYARSAKNAPFLRFSVIII